MRTRALLVLASLALLAAACGDSGTPVLPGSAAPGDVTTSSASPSPSPGTGAATSLEEARQAVVQIVAKGTFVDPFEGVQANVPGSGSGFIVDPSGLAVTNNHVVTGAALLEVFVEGEDQPRNARVIGVSECSDLAVIDIAGDGYPYLAWYEGPITAGMPILAAGYPLGDPEYTILDGVVAKEDADGETTWASVDAVIEHSADTLPGNSGGPILSEDGRVVAVNYAGNQAGQAFAIGRAAAQPVIEALLGGADLDTIGVNGEAFVGTGFSGIWAYSVASGSPADRAGVAAGDLILSLEGLDVGADGTMAEYCDVLRSHGPEDVLAIEVYRAGSDEVLEGQINGRTLEPTFSFATELDEVAEPTTEPAPDAPPAYSSYVQITDDLGLISVSVPSEWAEVSGAEWNIAGTLVGPALSAASDLDGFTSTWGVPGVFIAASNMLPLSATELLDGEDFSAPCTFVDRLDYDDGAYFGEFDVWEDCGDAASTLLVVVAEPPDGSFTILVEIQIVAERDLDAADEIIRTFLVDTSLGAQAQPPATLPPVTQPPATQPPGPGLATGLFCRDLFDLGFGYDDAAAYWVREGRPDRMDADRNGIPCETVYSSSLMDIFFQPVLSVEPTGLFCRDLADRGWWFSDALAYWIAEGAPDRMDADRNGIPCETIYPAAQIDEVLFFEYHIG